MSSSLLQAAAELADLTGRAAFAHFRAELNVDRKHDGSPVTVADRDAEKQAREWIARRFPGDGVLGEEYGETQGRSGRLWVLDPIDGTRTFVRGVPLWGSLVALVEGDTVLAGAAAFPAVGELIAAAPGEGCWYNQQRCRVSTTASLADSVVLTSDEHLFEPAQQVGWNRLVERAATVRTWGDCYGYLLVATGRAEVMADAKLHPWDIACFLPILAEAGGVLTDLGGRTAWNMTSAIATNAALAVEARACF